MSSCNPQKYSALSQSASGDAAAAADEVQYNISEEKLRIPQVQNVLATRGSRTPSPFRTLFKGMAKGTDGGAGWRVFFALQTTCALTSNLGTFVDLRCLCCIACGVRTRKS